MLSTEIKEWVIVKHSGAHEFITDVQAMEIAKIKASGEKSFPRYGGIGFTSFSTIADIMPIAKFYEQYPEHRPEYRPEFKPEPRETYKSIEEQSIGDTRRRDGLARGLKRYIDEADARGETAMNARAILEKWEKGHRNVTDTRTYHQKTVDKYKDKPNLTDSEKAHYQHALSKLKEFNVMA